MPTTTTIVELTGAHPRSEASIVERVRENLDPVGTTLFVATERQDFAVRESETRVNLTDVEIAEEDRFLERLLGLVRLEQEQGQSVTLASFLPTVSAMAARERAAGPAFQYVPLSAYLSSAAPVAADTEWDEAVVSRDDLAALMVRVVAAQPSGQVELVALRPLMGAADGRFIKANGPEGWRRPGFVSHMVHVVQEMGYVEEASDGPTGSGVRLTDEGRALARKTVSEPAGNRAATAALESGAPRQGKDPIVQACWDALSEDHWGPFQLVRDAVYDQLEHLVSSEPGTRNAPDLVSKAVRVVRLSGVAKQPWRSVQQFMIKLLRAEPVLLSAGEMVEPLYGIDQPAIDELLPDFRDLLDSRLVAVLVGIGVDLSYDDLWRLSAVLYGTRDAEERSERVLNLALRRGIVELDRISGVLLARSIVEADVPSSVTEVEAAE